jgi:hypothetical protein
MIIYKIAVLMNYRFQRLLCLFIKGEIGSSGDGFIITLREVGKI